MAGDCKFLCALRQVVSAPTLFSGLFASTAWVQNWCQMRVNIKNPWLAFLFSQSPPRSLDTSARRKRRHQRQTCLHYQQAGWWDLQACCSGPENAHRCAYRMYAANQWSTKLGFVSALFWMFLFSGSEDSCLLPVMGLFFETHLILHLRVGLNSVYPRLASNSWKSFFFSLPSAGMTGLSRHACNRGSFGFGLPLPLLRL